MKLSTDPQQIISHEIANIMAIGVVRFLELASAPGSNILRESLVAALTSNNSEDMKRFIDLYKMSCVIIDESSFVSKYLSDSDDD